TRRIMSKRRSVRPTGAVCSRGSLITSSKRHNAPAAISSVIQISPAHDAVEPSLWWIAAHSARKTRVNAPMPQPMTFYDHGKDIQKTVGAREQATRAEG